MYDCPRCRHMMRQVNADKDGGRKFYLCRNCANRMTLNVDRRGLDPDWPREIFQKAVEDRWIDGDGRVLPFGSI